MSSRTLRGVFPPACRNPLAHKGDVTAKSNNLRRPPLTSQKRWDELLSDVAARWSLLRSSAAVSQHAGSALGAGLDALRRVATASEPCFATARGDPLRDVEAAGTRALVASRRHHKVGLPDAALPSLKTVRNTAPLRIAFRRTRHAAEQCSFSEAPPVLARARKERAKQTRARKERARRSAPVLDGIFEPWRSVLVRSP